MNLLADFLETTLQLPATFPTLDLASVILRLVALLPLVGGYLLAREGKGNLLWEVLAVLLLVLATVVPVSFTTDSLSTVLTAYIDRWPVMVFLLGLAFVRDGGARIVIGVILMAVSGLIFLPHA
ncbi:MAG TPA: hypothetical protein VOB72_19420 [Candidatus Dormibacteraeota bacterium]|nr:hypothetical protein [Candidatus Dormibacteraeota bacterium]